MILFTVAEAASFLGVRPETLKRKEALGVYPQARRGDNNYRYYTVGDLLRLYRASFGNIDRNAVEELGIMLMKKGYEAEEAATTIRREMERGA